MKTFRNFKQHQIHDKDTRPSVAKPLKPFTHFRKLLRVSSSTVALSALMGPLAFAIDEPVLSDFNGELEPESLDGTGDAYGIMAGGQIIGSILDVELTGSVTAEPTGSSLSFDGSGDASGFAVLSWDGDDEAPELDPEGLGAINLTLEEIGFTTQDSFLLTFESVTAPGTFVIEVHSEEGEASSYSGSLTAGTPSVLIPYAAFTVSQGGGASFNGVGAITMTFGGGLVGEIDHFETSSALSGITMVDALQVDPGNNSTVEPGDTLRYTATIPASSSASGALLTCTLDGNTTLVVGSVTTTTGSVTTGNTPGDTAILVDLGTLPASPVTVTFDAMVNTPFSGTSPVCNQSSVSATGIPPVLSDDPDDPTGNDDPTCTAVMLDTEPPVLTLPTDTTVDQGTDNTPEITGTATATDNETLEPVITFSDSESQGPVPFQAVIIRTWTATDAAGNSSTADQTITLSDPVDRSLAVNQPTYGLFSPQTGLGKRQLGTIDTNGNVGLLGTDASLDVGNISTSAGFTTYSRVDEMVYVLGKTDSDGQSRIFSVDATDGSSTSAVLSFGSFNTLVGIWWDEVNTTLFGVFQVGAGLSDRQLGTIDPATGTVALVGSPTTLAGSIGGILTGNRSGNAIYFLGTTGGLPGAIYTVDLSTGTMTSVALSGANYNAIAGINYNQSDATLYALVFQGVERRLATLDPATGAVTLLGSTTIAGGGVPITTYTGVNTIDEQSGTFLFIGRYNNGVSNAWAIFGVNLTTGDTTFSEIDNSTLSDNGYYGLDYAESYTPDLTIVKVGFIGGEFYIDMEQGTAGLKVTSSDDLQLPFTDVLGVTEVNDGGGQPNRFLIPVGSLAVDRDFFRVETQ